MNIIIYDKTFTTKRGLALHITKTHNPKYVFSSFLNSIMAMGLNVVSSGAYTGSVRETSHQSPSRCQSGKAKYVSLFKNIRAILFINYNKCYNSYYMENNTWVLGNTRFISSVISRVSAANKWDIMFNTRNESGISKHHVWFCM
jgi:hypothetical protein